jgi:hypothetical protein
MSRSKIVKAINDLLSLLGSNTFGLVDEKTLDKVRKSYSVDAKNYSILDIKWTLAYAEISKLMDSFGVKKLKEGVSYDKKNTTHAYLKIGDKKHSLHSLNERTESDCLPISILMLFLVTRTKLDVETIQGFLEDHQEYLKNLLESTRFFLYLVGCLNEYQSVEIIFNLMFFLKGEYQIESKSGKKSESKISYNERVVSPKETKENSSNWSCNSCTFSNHFLMDKCEICRTPR